MLQCLRSESVIKSCTQRNRFLTNIIYLQISTTNSFNFKRSRPFTSDLRSQEIVQFQLIHKELTLIEIMKSMKNVHMESSINSKGYFFCT